MPDQTLRVLIVEDKENVATVLTRFLEPLRERFPKLHIDKVTTLAAALAIIRCTPAPDLVTLDLNLDDSGTENTMAHLPEIEERCPVVLVTGRNIEGFREMLADLQVEVIKKGQSWMDDNRFITACAAAITRRTERETQKMQTRLQKMRSLMAELYVTPTNSDASATA